MKNVDENTTRKNTQSTPVNTVSDCNFHGLLTVENRNNYCCNIPCYFTIIKSSQTVVKTGFKTIKDLYTAFSSTSVSFST